MLCQPKSPKEPPLFDNAHGSFVPGTGGDLHTPSLSGKVWRLQESPEDVTQALVERYDIPYITAQILVQRGYNVETAAPFLKPKLKYLLPDPFLLKDMDKGVQAVVDALQNCEKIAVFGDYDVDGATSSALLVRYFKEIGVDILTYIPDRIEEGYGPNVHAMQCLYDQGVRLVLMVDCGTLSFEPLAYAHNIGLKVVVIDHHLSQDTLPKATAVINPNRVDCDANTFANAEAVAQDGVFNGRTSKDANAPLPHYMQELCAAGMVFVFLVGLQKVLREKGHFASEPAPDLLNLLDLAALGTVCDVMPLTYLNRAFVSLGLEKMAGLDQWNHHYGMQEKVRPRCDNLGLKALLSVTRAPDAPSSYHLGFVLGPRINAGGRVGESWMGSHLLSTQSSEQAQSYALHLDSLNKERQSIERDMIQQAETLIYERKLYEKPVIILYHDTWHPGVIGIIASRMKELYQRPVLVITFFEHAEAPCQGGSNNDTARGTHIGKGSGRSIKGAALGEAMHDAVAQGILEQGGGHALAAGFSIRRDKISAFETFMCQRFQGVVDAHIPTLYLSGHVPLSQITKELFEAVHLLEPFGQGNPVPRFIVGPVSIQSCDTFGDGHMRLTLQDQNNDTVRALHFRASKQPYFHTLKQAAGDESEQGYLHANSPKSVPVTVPTTTHDIKQRHLKHAPQSLKGCSAARFYFACSLKHDTWGGRDDVVLHIEDMRA